MNPNIPLPTRFELATLAASMQGRTPGEKARAALDLWEASGQLIEDRRKLYQSAAARDEDLLSLLPGVSPGDVMEFDAFLAAIMPKKKRADRVAAWRRYLRHPSPGEERMSESRVADVMARDRKCGIGTPHFRGMQFLRWLEADAARTRSERAKAGGAAKNRKAAKKTLGRTSKR